MGLLVRLGRREHLGRLEWRDRLVPPGKMAEWELLGHRVRQVLREMLD